MTLFGWTATKNAFNEVFVNNLQVPLFVLFKNFVYLDDLLKLDQALITVEQLDGVIAMVVRVT